MSGGAIVGIVVGVLLALVLAIGVITWARGTPVPCIDKGNPYGTGKAAKSPMHMIPAYSNPAYVGGADREGAHELVRLSQQPQLEFNAASRDPKTTCRRARVQPTLFLEKMSSLSGKDEPASIAPKIVLQLFSWEKKEGKKNPVATPAAPNTARGDDTPVSAANGPRLHPWSVLATS